MSWAARPLAIVVVNYASTALLAQNLVRVHAGRRDADVVVVDNRSTAAEAQAVQELCAAHRWHLVVLRANRGFGGGMNAGVAAAIERGAQDLLLLNPDAVIGAPDLSLLQAAVADSRLALAAPVIVDAFGRTWFRGVELDLRTGSMHRATPGRAPAPGRRLWLTGACLLITAEVWSLVGGFDE